MLSRSALTDLRTAVIALLFFTLLTGLAYPLAITGIAQTAFEHEADGSVITDGAEAVVGSSLVGQQFQGPEYFHSRPSAGDYSGLSGGSNLGPASQELADRVEADVARIRKENGLSADQEIPVDAVTASASGLDPHISSASAELQVARVAEARGMSEDTVRQLVDEYTDGATFGIVGEPRVNVLLLNLALDRAQEER